jgi:hypothetical protein
VTPSPRTASATRSATLNSWLSRRPHDAEQQLRAGVVQRGEPDLVEEDQVVAEQGIYHPPDGVVGQAAVKNLGELGGGEVADFVPGLHGGDAERDEQVALAGAGRTDWAEVLAGADPFQGGHDQVHSGPPVPTAGSSPSGAAPGEPAHRGQFQPAQPLGQVGGQLRRGRGHDSPPMA